MDFIAYNTTLNIKTLVKNKQEEKSNKEDAKQREFEENKKKLLPHVLKYLHYLAELHNEIVIKNAFVENYCNNIRATSGMSNANPVEIDDVLEKYTADHFFSANGLCWECNMFKPVATRYAPKIWLNAGKLVQATPNLPYSMSGAKDQYATSIEDYIVEIAEMTLKMERSK